LIYIQLGLQFHQIAATSKQGTVPASIGHPCFCLSASSDAER
jgi:hypothetical protein